MMMMMIHSSSCSVVMSHPTCEGGGEGSVNGQEVGTVEIASRAGNCGFNVGLEFKGGLGFSLMRV
jgi:hypothetical protein